MARSVGREYSLSMSVIRLINSGVFDRHPNLIVHMSHLGGGISSIIGRIRSDQDKVFWGTKGNARHGMLPKRPFDDYIRDNIIFDIRGNQGNFASKGGFGHPDCGFGERPIAEALLGTHPIGAAP